MKRHKLFPFGVFAFWLVVTALLTVVGLAFGQASQPTSQPITVVAISKWSWILANLFWLVPLAVNVLSSIAVALKNYPKGEGIAKVIWLIVAFLGNCEFKDGKWAGFVMKAPLTQAALPPNGVNR